MYYSSCLALMKPSDHYAVKKPKLVYQTLRGHMEDNPAKSQTLHPTLRIQSGFLRWHPWERKEGKNHSGSPHPLFSDLPSVPSALSFHLSQTIKLADRGPRKHNLKGEEEPGKQLIITTVD
jgi:hypothetical protein